MSRRAGALRVLIAAAVLGLALAGCGEGGGVSLPSERPGSALPTDATRPTLPSVTAPTRTVVPPPLVTTTARPATPAPPTTTAPPTTAPPTTVPPTTVPPTTVPPTTPPTTAPPTTAPTTAAPSSTASPTTTPSGAAVPVASSSSPSAWVWWLLGGLLALIVAALAVLAVRARRARKAWEARLAGVVAESTWLAREFLPYALGGGPAVNRRDVWAAFRPRVQALVNNLNAVTASASTGRMPTVDRLRAAVTDVSAAMDRHAAADPQDRETLGAVRQAQRQLEEALRVLQPPPVS